MACSFMVDLRYKTRLFAVGFVNVDLVIAFFVDYL